MKARPQFPSFTSGGGPAVSPPPVSKPSGGRSRWDAACRSRRSAPPHTTPRHPHNSTIVFHIECAFKKLCWISQVVFERWDISTVKSKTKQQLTVLIKLWYKIKRGSTEQKKPQQQQNNLKAWTHLGWYFCPSPMTLILPPQMTSIICKWLLMQISQWCHPATFRAASSYFSHTGVG